MKNQVESTRIELVRYPDPDYETRWPDAVHPVLGRVYAHRGLQDPDELTRGLDRLPAPDELGGVTQGAALLLSVIQQGGRILIIGDFDVDGASSCALMVRALSDMGVDNVGYLTPDRFRYGYGLTPEVVEEALMHKPDLLLTVDTGISSHAGIAAAKMAGVSVLVTDHHLPGSTLPEADVIINPKLPGERFLGHSLAGVGVAFYLLAGLRSKLRELGWFQQHVIDEPNLANYLDLVALGTIADVVPLDWVNRILVYNGLQRIRRGRGCAGINALVEISRKDLAWLQASDLAFFVAPKLNAAGRLEDMSLGIQCLLSDRSQEARKIALDLDRLNQERRQIEKKMQDQAEKHLAQVTLEQDNQMAFGLSLFQESWHQGVIGILAARIRDRFHRPVIAFALDEHGELKGSARSISGFHIRDGLDAVASRHPGLLVKFGGHAMAAGLSLKRADFERFCDAFDQEVRRSLGAEQLRGEIWSDGVLSSDELTLELAQAVWEAEPWGQGFSEPCFDGQFSVISRRVVGERHLKLVVVAEGGKQSIDAIAFNQADQGETTQSDKIRAAYRLSINRYQGDKRLQLIIERMWPEG